MKYTTLGRPAPTRKVIFATDGRGGRTADAGHQKKLDLTQQYLDLVAEQAVLYPVVHTELMTAWDSKKLTGIRAQPYPGINLLQAKRA